MGLYQIVWEEKMSAIVKAKSAKEARELALNGEVVADTSELSSDVIAYKLPNQK